MRTLSLFLTLILCAPLYSADKTVAEKLQDISVTVRCGRGQGSGVIILRGDTNYVLTAGHVVADLRRKDEKRIYFDDAEVIQELVEDGRKVGVLSFSAKVISYSRADKPGEDIAILQLYKKNAYPNSVTFAPAAVVPIGTKLLHVGSLLGQYGSNSMTSGLLSRVGRVLDDTVYDQTSCTAFPGSSGGGVFTEEGHYIGMVVRGAGEGFNFIVPVRRIATWTKRVHAEFILDPEAEVTKPILEENQNDEKTAVKAELLPPPIADCKR